MTLGLVRLPLPEAAAGSPPVWGRWPPPCPRWGWPPARAACCVLGRAGADPAQCLPQRGPPAEPLPAVGDRGDRRLPGCGDPDLFCRYHVGQSCVPVLRGRGAGRGLCAAGPARPGARPRRLSRGVCAEDAGNLAAEAWWMDGRAQVRGQHRPGPALALAGGRALQLWPLPEGSLLHAVAGEMRCRLRQEPRGPSAPPELGRPSELPPSGRWRPCPEPLLQSPGPLDGGVRVSPRPGAGLQCQPFCPGSPARPLLPGPEGCAASWP